MAQLRQVSTTSQPRQTTFALSIWRNAGLVVPIGKNISGSSSRQAARLRQVIRIGLLGSRTWGWASCESVQGGASRGHRVVPANVQGNATIKDKSTSMCEPHAPEHRIGEELTAPPPPVIAAFRGELGVHRRPD